MENISSVISDLQDWFRKTKRNFPWRKNPSAYEVWVSEVMLQQTRASVVVSYFERWMKTFPSIETLSKAQPEEIIKLWEGLGYYQRARNLFHGAKQIMQEYGGKIPSSEEELKRIKGIGPYTMGAILAFGFKRPKAALDANALRVLSRVFLVEENICLEKTKKRIGKHMEGFLQKKNPSETMEAIIELGATICLPNPKCALCPLNSICKALQKNKQKLLPIKNKPKKALCLKRAVLVFQHGQRWLIFKQRSKQVMEDLYQFPYFDFMEKHITIKQVQEEIQKNFALEYFLMYPLSTIKQYFTKYNVTLFPFLIEVKERKIFPHFIWVSLDKMKQLPFSSGHKKIYQTL